MKLHQHVVGCRASIHPQHLDHLPAVRTHGAKQIINLQRDTLESSPRNVSPRRPSRQSSHDPAGVGIPMRRSQPGQRRNQYNTAGVFNLLCKSLYLTATLEEAETIPKPLNHCTGNEHTAFDGVGGLSIEVPGDRRE